jgi:hypothetical protein
LRVAVQGLQRALTVAQYAEAPKAIFEEESAILSDCHSARTTLQELAAEMLFETRNTTADFRFWKAEEVAGFGEAFGLDNLGENDEIAEIEH